MELGSTRKYISSHKILQVYSRLCMYWPCWVREQQHMQQKLEENTFHTKAQIENSQKRLSKMLNKCEKWSGMLKIIATAYQCMFICICVYIDPSCVCVPNCSKMACKNMKCNLLLIDTDRNRHR